MPGRKRLRKILAWSLVLVLATVAGAVGFAYSYVTDSATLREFIQQQAPRFVPGSTVWVERVRLRPFVGQLTLSKLLLWQVVQGERLLAAQVSWIGIRHDLKALARGEFAPSQVILAQPVLRLRRRSDGSWNLQGLLADPWPGKPPKRWPIVMVTGGTIELRDGTPADAPTMILRDVALSAEPGEDGIYRIEGSARGGPFDRLRLEGTFDPRTFRLALSRGELTRLELAETFCHCLPEHARHDFRRLGLDGGELDVALNRLTFDPHAAPAARLRYSAALTLRAGTLNRPELPFPLMQLSAAGTIADGTLTLDHASGRNGKTLVQVRGTCSAVDPERQPLRLQAEVLRLEFDERLRAKTPREYAPLWDEYQPRGWVNLALNVERRRVGGPLAFGLGVACQDVGLRYHLFPYPLQHIQGTLNWQGPKIAVDLRTIIGGAPVTCTGTIEDPGPDAIVALEFRGSAMPVDEVLLRALPPDIRTVVEDFRPTGSVRGVVHLARRPPPAPGLPEDVRIHAELDLNEGCSMRWKGMPYLITDLTGHLDLQPTRWTFTNMKGRNGPALIEADGQVVEVRPRELSVKLALRAQHLPFDQQLRDALPPEWQATWDTLTPSGSSRVEADIRAEPGAPPSYHLRITPEPDTRVRLVLTPVGAEGGAPGAPPRTIKLPPMENIAGSFLFDDGTVTMSNVTFLFREAPVRVRSGTVVLHDTGQFLLKVQDLLVTKLRLDPELRSIMPPVMAQFAQRLDDNKTFWIRTDLGIGWSGKPGEPARVEWQKATIVLAGNTIRTGLPMEDLQGQIDHGWGWSDGRQIVAHGRLNLESVRLAGQQIAPLQAQIDVEQGWARFGQVRGKLLGGVVAGQVDVSLDATPRYRARLTLDGADLAQYTRTVPGRQELRGTLSAGLDVGGEGSDWKAVTGRAEAHVVQGDLGQLPLPLRWAKVPNFRPPTRTAFDAAELYATIDGGRATLHPIKLTGDAISLVGSGTAELEGGRELDLRLNMIYGRDERRVPILSDAMREASGRVFTLHVTGPISAPEIRPEPLPDVLTRASQAFRRMGQPRPDSDRDRPTR